MNKTLSNNKINDLFKILESRFEQNINRHKNIKWSEVKERLTTNDKAIASLLAMEETGGEPDVVSFDKENKEYLFVDCSVESPIGRRSLCYDKEALDSRKKNKPKGNVIDMSNDMGIELLCESDYRMLQGLGEFDLKTSSWIATPLKIRKLGGALFCDRRYDTVFVYHNGAESYYAARGFRGKLRI